MEKITKNTKNKGITLIALVITIIVLLILAGISISMLSGDNSILSRAGQVKEETGRSNKEELKKIAAMEALTNLEETTYNGVTIPAGFAPTKLEGESTVDEGLVIIDSKENEFVWIEVPKSVTKNATTDEEIYDALRNYCDPVISKTGGDYKTGTMRILPRYMV